MTPDNHRPNAVPVKIFEQEAFKRILELGQHRLPIIFRQVAESPLKLKVLQLPFLFGPPTGDFLLFTFKLKLLPPQSFGCIPVRCG
ncbi:MAG: hypothetical protein GY820_00735 [Gammaproteobacteria bacterium]|nr:hypothetical protein [Gammaproteobacteria bacterium]